MDGAASHFLRDQPAGLSGFGLRQRTLKAEIDCYGVGLHSGAKVHLVLAPAPADTGIVFRRAGLDGTVAARWDNVVDTRLCTALAAPGRPELRIGTVEHLMAAFAGSEVHNAFVTVDGPELPILDGSAEGFHFLIDCAGTVEQDAMVSCIEVLRPIRVERGQAFAELHPALEGFEVTASIAFQASAIGSQSRNFHLDPASFRAELSRARTFTLAEEVEQLRAAGLAQGGSLANAVVVDGGRVLNPGGLRMQDEFIRHKLLDAVGDLALAGAPLVARMVGHRSGHALNNELLRALFADPANYRRSLPGAAGWQARLPAAAAPA